jgi:hypothetical protein
MIPPWIIFQMGFSYLGLLSVIFAFSVTAPPRNSSPDSWSKAPEGDYFVIA